MRSGSRRQIVAELVDELLASAKVLAGGLPTWRSGTRDHDERLAWPVLVDGETDQCELAATCYPDESPDRFTIVLSYANRCIWRIDHELLNRSPHRNPLDRADLLGAYEVRGPHYHSWDDNRYLATLGALPTELLCARPLAPQARGWENAFRWFCGETGIQQPADIPYLPPRGRLL
jgi:hypothetical protein